ncbi:MAG: CpaF family protein [Lachnospiraceae bacterium]|nr:CpaF family protein [Lachnospiraceae bacterium]
MLKNRISSEVLKDLESFPVINDDEVLRLIDKNILEQSRSVHLSLNEKLSLRKEIFNSIRRLDILEDFIEDESVTEVMVNGVHSIFYEKDGVIRDSGKCFSSRQKLEDIIQQIVAKANRTVNTSSPIVDARLEDGSRVNVVLPPVAINGPILTIRRFPKDPVDEQKLIAFGAINEELSAFMKKLVISKYNILISGGTGAGKTTFLNVLSGFIPQNERIITIEDSAELQIRGIGNLVRLEARNSNVEGCTEISIRDLIKASLRMRPDRIIVGEVRGQEAIDMLQAFNVGQDGSLSTIHANSAKDALSRLETMMLMSSDIPAVAIRKQMASGIDIVIQLGRLRDKSRRLFEVIEIAGMKDNDIETRRLYSFMEEGEIDGRITGRFVRENELLHTDKLKKAGLYP